MCKPPPTTTRATTAENHHKVKELKAARAAAEATAIKGKPLELVVADESGNPRKASTVSAASMSTRSMMRGILNPRSPTEAELGMWWMFLRDVVRSSMGIVSAEIWQDVDDSAGVVLKRIAYYTDPNYEAFDASEELLNGDPGECVPGVGMAGVLWDMMAQKGAPVEWRLLSGIAADEDIPDDPRIDAAAKAFGHVGAQYLEGRQPYASMWGANEAEHDNGAMLLFFARGGTTGDETQKLLNLLNNPANVAYFRTTATLGGAMVAQAASRATLNQAKVNRTEAWRKLRLLLASGQFLELVKAEVEKIESGEVKLVDKPRTRWETFVFDAKDWLRVYAKKFKGVPGAKAPKIAGIKAFVAWRTCAYTWFGTAISLLVLSALSQLTATETDGAYFLMLGSFGALMALHYGAPNSPLAQPRNALGGCTLAATISILFYYLSGPEFANALPKWAAQALAPATAIAVSQRFNLLHPPAGAVALIFVSGGAKVVNLGWMYLVTPLLVGNCICCLVAMLLNNAVKGPTISRLLVRAARPLLDLRLTPFPPPGDVPLPVLHRLSIRPPS